MLWAIWRLLKAKTQGGRRSISQTPIRRVGEAVGFRKALRRHSARVWPWTGHRGHRQRHSATVHHADKRATILAIGEGNLRGRRNASGHVGHRQGTPRPKREREGFGTASLVQHLRLFGLSARSLTLRPYSQTARLVCMAGTTLAAMWAIGKVHHDPNANEKVWHGVARAALAAI